MSLFDDVKKNLIEWYTATTEKTSEMAKVTSRRYDKFGISRDIERQFSELGSLVYNGLKEERRDVLDDPEVLALVRRLDELETELRAKNREIDEIRRDYQARKERAAGKVETVMKEPALEEGPGDAAILVEPERKAREHPPAAEATTEDPGEHDSRQS